MTAVLPASVLTASIILSLTSGIYLQDQRLDPGGNGETQVQAYPRLH